MLSWTKTQEEKVQLTLGRGCGTGALASCCSSLILSMSASKGRGFWTLHKGGSNGAVLNFADVGLCPGGPLDLVSDS